jgi:hypothetical protein
MPSGCRNLSTSGLALPTRTLPPAPTVGTQGACSSSTTECFCNLLVAIYELLATSGRSILAFCTSSRLLKAIILLLIAAPLDGKAGSVPPSYMLFPPANCSATELRIIVWQDGASSTRCATGQQILRLALPGCKAGQHVEFNGDDFVCAGAPVSKEKPPL